ncbi:MAG: lysylphosphatidylglycerol synthase transmembrane domain-containing protein [Myxococcales bacterium]
MEGLPGLVGGAAASRAPPEADRPSRWLRWLPWIFSLALLAAVIVAARHFSEAEEFAHLAERAKPWWLLLAVAFQLGTYLAQGQILRRVARAGRASLSLGTACRVGLAKLFVDQAVPSAGLSGTIVLANTLEAGGLPRPVVAAGIVVDLASYYAAFVLGLAAALVVTALRRDVRVVLALVSLVFFLFAIGFSALVLALSGRSTSALPKRLVRFRPLRITLGFIQTADPHLAHDPRILAEATAYQLAIILCDTATVWVLIRSLGGAGAPAAVFASFMISSLLRTIGIVPGGLGTFEAASVVTLRMVGVKVSVALAATLLFRGLSFWLPMLPGLWFSRRALGRR